MSLEGRRQAIAAERDIVQELAAKLQPIFEKYRVLRAFVFGSIAKGEMSRRSDLDILVVLKTEKRFLDRYDGLLREIAKAAPERPVDLLIYTPEELAELSDRPLIATALREGKVLYESSQKSFPPDIQTGFRT